MDNINTTSPQKDSGISINEEIKEYLLVTAKWAKFLSILGFIGIGLMFLVILISMVVNSSSYSSYGYNRSNASVVSFFMFIIIAIVYFFPINYLFRFSNEVKRGIDFENQDSFTEGIRNLKSHYKYVGIAAIVVLSFYILMILMTFVMLSSGY